MDNPKQVAGRRAADLVENGMTLGLGTGSTVFFVLERLAQRIRDEFTDWLERATDPDDGDRSVDTLLVIAILFDHYPDQKKLYSRAVRNARKFLFRKLGVSPTQMLLLSQRLESVLVEAVS